jgi:zinc protease
MVNNLHAPGLYEMSLHAREGVEAERLLEAFDALIDRARSEPPSAGELERARARVELGMLQMLETAAGKADQIGFCETVLGDPAAVFARLEAYARVSAEDVWRVCRQYLAPETRTVVEVAPLDLPGLAASRPGAEDA